MTNAEDLESTRISTMTSGHLDRVDEFYMGQVGRYELRERLGDGGMAVVYKARDPSIGRDVAIKFLHKSMCQQPDARERFLSEARAAGGLSHSNIVTVYDVGEIGNRPYMAMELIVGKTLSEFLAVQPKMGVRDVVVMGIELASSLDYAHTHGIVHRDIKPGNIMRLRNGSVKVTDFGIAHMESVESESRTKVGDVLGTPHYMSPEQARGEKIDGRSDLFSLGIVLYQALCGKRPFEADTVVALGMKISTSEPEPIELLRPETPASLRRVLMRCMAKQPSQRFNSGAELAAALSGVLKEMDDLNADVSHRPKVPLRVKWAVAMAAIVSVVMAITASIIHQQQNSAMVRQATEYGASLTRFLAAQNAVPVLSEDWEAIEISIQEMMKERDLENIVVIDHTGLVRAAGSGQTGSAFVSPVGKALEGLKGGVKVLRYEVKGESVLEFEAPITFQSKNLGKIALSLPERPLLEVARLSLTLMAVLVLVTVIAVAIAMYFVANWFAQPIKLISESLQEIGKGHFGYRIREQRKDEFGQLYLKFDQMAQALGERFPAPGQFSSGAQKKPDTDSSSSTTG
jgi:eukaryotic-like serine/threonine-protein kinase